LYKVWTVFQGVSFSLNKLADLAMGHGEGTPYMTHRERFLGLVRLYPCVLACPSWGFRPWVFQDRRCTYGNNCNGFPERCLAISNPRTQRVPWKM